MTRWIRLIGTTAVLWFGNYLDDASAVEPYGFDWLLRQSFGDCRNVSKVANLIRVPHVGHDLPPAHQCHREFYFEMQAQNQPLAILIREKAGPADGIPNADALDSVISQLAESGDQLDFVFAAMEFCGPDGPNGPCDFERVKKNVQEMVDLTRTRERSPNHAFIGSYLFYPGLDDSSRIVPPRMDNEFRHQFYKNSGLNVAMPEAYPYAHYSQHTDPHVWGENVAPNAQAALFWAPLEQVSVAARAIANIPEFEDHLLIPWVSGFVPQEGNNVAPTPKHDLLALMRHLRLRGSDGYYLLSVMGTPGWPNDDFRIDVNVAWNEIDSLLVEDSPRVILNKETDKQSGVQWSGVATSSSALLHFSNLSDDVVHVSIENQLLTIENDTFRNQYELLEETFRGLKREEKITASDPHMTLLLVKSLGDLDSNGTLDLEDLNALAHEVMTDSHAIESDFNKDQLVNRDDLLIWVRDFKGTWIGDANLDGEFNSGDLVSSFKAGHYERRQPATWEAGDWDGNGFFESADLVFAFRDGGYEQGPRMSVQNVPEPMFGCFASLFAVLTIVSLSRFRSF